MRNARATTLLAALMLLVAPAVAGAQQVGSEPTPIDVHDPGPGVDVDVNGSSGNIRWCDARGNLYLISFRDGVWGDPIPWLRAPNIQCTRQAGRGYYPLNRVSWAGVNGKATVGWEVWRFYGTVEEVQAWTVSRINMPEWGSEKAAVAVGPHPDDASGGAPSPAAGPYRAAMFTSRHGEVVSLNERGHAATNPPFRFGGGRCDSIPLRQNQVEAAIGAPTVASQVQNAYERIARLGSSNGGWASSTARMLTDLRGAPAGVGSIPGLYGDGVPCTSFLEYAPVAEGSISDQNLLVGYCVVPVERLGTYFNTSDGPVWQARFSGGLRYGASTTSSPLDQFTRWRDTIQREVASRSGANTIPSNLTIHTGDRYAPGPAIIVSEGDLVAPAYNLSLAAAQAASGADCRLAPGANAPGENGTTDGPPRLIIDVEIPEVFQIGGSLRPGQIVEAGHSTLFCDGGECPTRTGRQQVQQKNRALTADHIYQVQYQLTVKVDGLVLCRTSNVAERCDYTLDGPDDRTGWTAYPSQPAGEPRTASAQQTAASHRERRQQLELSFYAATNPGEAVHIGIRDISATYATYSWGSTQLGVTGCVVNIDGADLGTTGNAPSQGDQDRRWDGQDYFTGTPGGSVTQYRDVWRYDDIIYHVIPQLDGTYAGRAAPWTEYVNGRWEKESVVVPAWVCRTGVYDDVETSTVLPLRRDQIEVRGTGSRPVIGVNQLNPW